jgi:hypothetical protein
MSRIRASGRTVRIHARGREPSAACPGCAGRSGRVHSRYGRTVGDAAVANRQSVLHLRVRRFFCDVAGCAKKTCAEQIPGLTFRHGRCTLGYARFGMPWPWRWVAGGPAGRTPGRRRGQGRAAASDPGPAGPRGQAGAGTGRGLIPTSRLSRLVVGLCRGMPVEVGSARVWV